MRPVSSFVHGDNYVLVLLCLQVASRDDGLMVQTTESADPALTRDPLVVLVDDMSASASEIVSGKSAHMVHAVWRACNFI
jgi:hypothetical protein